MKEVDIMSKIKVENDFEYRKWVDEIPFLPFPKGWEVSIIPPFAGAIVRFRVREKNGKESVSIYLDCYDQLGFMGEPYWEVYPYDGDIARCSINETDRLIGFIKKSLKGFRNPTPKQD